MKDWLVGKLAALFGPKYIGATVRTLLAALAGFLVSMGIDSTAVEQLTSALNPVLTGLLTLAATWIWSMFQKKNNSK